ncbi:MAG: PD40 domain-containing protein [Pyrinomonadaceae bacterium]|nr:PD40 domain-containing protein [Pyrinomonadaceae bacterium]
MKQVFKSQCAIAAFVLVLGTFSYVLGQAPSATPNPFVVQLTSSPSGFQSFAGDISLNGRFVVVESNGDISTEKVPTRNSDGTLNPNPRNNEDGNRELFLIDYAQRRIFQITNTRNVQKPATTPTPTPTPTPSPSPTPTPGPTPADPTLVKYEISINRPMISFEPVLVGAPPGSRTYTIVFSSNSPTLPNFEGTDLAGFVGTTTNPAREGNQELWIYQFTATEVADLSAGADVAFQDLSSGAFTRLTDTTCSRPTGLDPNIRLHAIDDNREASISDNGSTIAFISTADLVSAVGNADRNPELFFWTPAGITQGTKTQDEFDGPTLMSRFQQNPSLSADGTRVAFISTADLATPGTNNDNGRGKGNEEVYLATVGSGLSNVRQVTKTKKDALALTVNKMSFGRRMSRDARFIAFESIAEVPDANTGTNKLSFVMFVFDLTDQSIKQVGVREADDSGDIFHEPTFTDYKGTLTPATLIFASVQNIKPDGTLLAFGDTAGLNPTNQPQLFVTQLPVGSGNTFARLTTNPIGAFAGLRPLGSDTIKRIAFSLGGTEFGTGNSDLSTEAFYLLTPSVLPPDSSAALSFFAKPSTFPVAAATPAPSPSPSPTPLPTPGTIALGLAAGEFSMIRSTVGLANSDPPQVTSADETKRSPILPAELAGVSVSVNGAAAGLYFVGNTDKRIDFVMPPGLAPGLGTVVINNNGTVFRGLVQIVPAQPDILNPPTNDAGGRAYVCNVTNTSVSGCVREPFKVMSTDSTGASVATVLEVHLTGVRGILPGETKITIGTTDIIPTSVRRNTNMYGLDIITFTLPSTLVPGDYPIIVTVTKSGTFSSRAAATAPRIEIIGP